MYTYTFEDTVNQYESTNKSSIQWADLSIIQKLEKCEAFKQEGNASFNNKNNEDYGNALHSYSQGISIFRYFEKKDKRGEH